jgi:hypothetical protein
MNDLNAMLATMGFPEIGTWSLITTLVLSVPPLFVMFSKRATGGTKVLWFVLTSIFSWLAYAAFLYATRSQVASQEGKPPG